MTTRKDLVAMTQSYDASLDFLPDTALAVDTREGLLEIQDPRYNLVIWRREEKPDITDFFNLLDAPTHISVGSRAGFKKEVYSLQDHPGRGEFFYEYRKLSVLMKGLQEGSRSILSVMDRAVSGHSFHQDEGFTINWTVVGPGGIWIEDAHARPIKSTPGSRHYMSPSDPAVIRQLPTGCVAIYKGFESGAPFPPLVHSRPPRAQGVRRVLHQIYL